MIRRVCVMGNSHVACLRQAWRDDPGRWPDLAPTFVGAHQELLLDTTERDRRLVPTSAEMAAAFARHSGIDAVALDEMDAFVIAGCSISMGAAANFYRNVNWVGLPSVVECADLAALPATLMSREAAVEALEDMMFRRFGARLARHLRRMTDRPILVTSQPRISAAMKTRPSRNTHAYRLARAGGDMAELGALFEWAADSGISASGARYLPQPPETIEDHILTDRAFMDGAIRLTPDGATPQPKGDIAHANARYGALVLDQIAAALAA